jgi:hypothetical protein
MWSLQQGHVKFGQAAVRFESFDMGAFSHDIPQGNGRAGETTVLRLWVLFQCRQSPVRGSRHVAWRPVRY